MNRSIAMLTLGTILGVGLVAGTALSEEGEGADPFVGRSRAEIADLLGEPDKVRSKGGRETLVYRLVRLADDGGTAPGLIAFDLPGVGRVGRALSAITGQAARVEVGPTKLNRRGVDAGGNIEPSTTYSKTYELNKEDKELKKELVPEDRPGSRGRVKLQLELDSEGRIRAWRTTPKREAESGR